MLAETEIVTHWLKHRNCHLLWNTEIVTCWLKQRLLLTGWNMKCHWLKQRDCHWNKETVTEIKRLSLSETRRCHRLKQRLSLPKTQSVKHSFFVSVNDWNKETVTNWNRETVTKRLSETVTDWNTKTVTNKNTYSVYVTDCLKINTKIAIGWLKHRLSLTKTQILLLRMLRKRRKKACHWLPEQRVSQTGWNRENLTFWLKHG